MFTSSRLKYSINPETPPAPTKGERPPDRAADRDGAGAESEGFRDIRAAANAAVHDDRTFPSLSARLYRSLADQPIFQENEDRDGTDIRKGCIQG